MNSDDRIAATHQALGEFVILFLWVENIYRQIGWFILNPEQDEWPPMGLRKEKNSDLIKKVTKLYIDLTSRYAFPNGADIAQEMRELEQRFHDLRKYRNRVLHSTYIEMKAGGVVHGYVRSNPQVGVDSDSGELIYDQEDFSAELIYSTVREYGDYIFRLNLNLVQLRHWHPWEKWEPGT